MTPEEYLSLPEEQPYLEYVDGVVLQKPMASIEHGQIALEIGSLLRAWTREHGGRAAVEARARVGELPNFRIPDVSFWDADAPREPDTMPTLAIEIRSAGQTMDELRAKCRFFRANGVSARWLIDPVSQTAEVFEGKRDGAVTNTLEAACVPGFSVTVAAVFAAIA